MWQMSDEDLNAEIDAVTAELDHHRSELKTKEEWLQGLIALVALRQSEKPRKNPRRTLYRVKCHVPHLLDRCSTK